MDVAMMLKLLSVLFGILLLSLLIKWIDDEEEKKDYEDACADMAYAYAHVRKVRMIQYVSTAGFRRYPIRHTNPADGQFLCEFERLENLRKEFPGFVSFNELMKKLVEQL
jgi:hypothetical protein